MIEHSREIPAGDEAGAWCDPATGELLAERTPTAIWIPDDDLSGPPVPEATWPDWTRTRAFGDWWTERLARFEGELAALEESSRLRLARAKATIRHHRVRWLADLERLAQLEIRGKRKSVDFSAGSLGWRRSTGWEIDNEDDALLWAIEHCPAACRIERRLMVSALPKGLDEIPGAHRPRDEKFFARVTRAKREEGVTDVDGQQE